MASESTVVHEQATPLSGPLAQLQQIVLEQQVAVESWFRHQWGQTRPPFYGSVDLRNAGYKLAPVDTNLFPAGFNNINPEYLSLYAQAMQATMQEICPSAKRLLLIPEAHTRNLFYFESVAVLYDILTHAGFEVRIGSLNEELPSPHTVELPSGRSLTLEKIQRQGERVGVDDFFPCCIVLNNDMSAGIPDILQNIDQRVMPPMQLGWSNRLKSEHFRYYEQVANEFAEKFSIDPWTINPWFEQCPEVNFMKKEGEACLADRAEGLLKRIKEKYTEYKLEQDPFLVVKADQGTYGMAVMMVRDAEELRNLNRKQRTRMSTLKGGVPVTRAIVQEGVYTSETVEDNAVAEPVVYMLGRNVIGGFYRVHKNRGPDENLNAPGMNFSPLPFAHPCNIPCVFEPQAHGRFYLYGVVARLALLAAARELNAFERGNHG